MAFGTFKAESEKNQERIKTDIFETLKNKEIHQVDVNVETTQVSTFGGDYILTGETVMIIRYKGKNFGEKQKLGI